MARVFVDTGAVFALIDRDDANHGAARRGLKTFKAQRLEPLVSTFVVAESHAFLVAGLDATLARSWLLGNVWPIERVREEDEARARAIIARYTDKVFTYVDAT